MKLLLKKLVIFGVIVASITALHYSGIASCLTWSWFLEHREMLQSYVARHYVYSVVLYILFYVVTSAVALPGTFIITMTGGFLFKLFPGIIFVNIGATLGAVCSFLVSRYVLGDAVQQRYQQRLSDFNKELNTYGVYYMLILRTLIIAPFFLVNLLAGLTQIPLSTFAWTTSLGIIPAITVYIIAGQELAHACSPMEILSVPLILAFCMLTVILVTSLILKKRV
jgi:uncharacterized membrane protein YdjX (TVP38/TMEM64 family)